MRVNAYILKQKKASRSLTKGKKRIKYIMNYVDKKVTPRAIIKVFMFQNKYKKMSEEIYHLEKEAHIFLTLSP